jgi:Holliday junction resolvase RusA-like endonuclease
MSLATSKPAKPAFVTLTMPVPPSVNRTRRVDWANAGIKSAYYLRTDLELMAAHSARLVRKILGPYELSIVIPAHSRMDLDNHIKVLIDYLVSREFVPADSKKYLRKISIAWGSGTGCLVTIRELAP